MVFAAQPARYNRPDVQVPGESRMNSRQRVIAALERRVPDRVPYFECVIDERVQQALLPGCDYFQFNDWLEIDNVGQNRSSWSRDNVEYIDEARGACSATSGA